VVLFLFLSHLGIGVAFTLAFVSRQAGVKFFRFNAGLAAAMIAAGLAFQPIWPAGPADAPSVLRLAATALVWGCLAALVAYWLIVGRRLPALRPILLYGAIASGAAAILLQAWLVAWDVSLVKRALTALSFLTSALFLGGASSSMILGHWYLVIPSLDVAHLQSIVKLHIISIVLRTVVVVAVVVVAIGTWQPGLGLNFRRYIFSVSGIFFWQRVLFGLVGPAVLGALTWETAKIRSTQSATGILYVDFFAVIVGEVLAKYLLLETNVPV
jgi:hypothetical protein